MALIHPSTRLQRTPRRSDKTEAHAFDGLFMMRQFESESQLHGGSSRAAVGGGGNSAPADRMAAGLAGSYADFMQKHPDSLKYISTNVQRERESSALKT